ncbi:MAG: sarcosine oxidase subunit delta [Acidimicrobiia bacterium]
MLRLACPNCGERSVVEFRYGEIPIVPEGLTDPEARDLDRAFMRSNIEGIVTERWFHEAGCRRWMTVRRDTRTDEVLEIVSQSSGRRSDRTA